MKKKNQKLLKYLALLVVGIFLLNYYGVFEAISPFSLEGQNTVYGESYVCGDGLPDTDYCDVTGTLICNEPTGEDRIIFRTNSYSSSGYHNDGTWIAINGRPCGRDFCSTSDLIGYCYDGTTSTSARFVNRYTVHGNRIGTHNSRLYIEQDDAWRLFTEEACTSQPITIQSPVDGFEDREEVGGEGGVVFDCSGEFKVNGITVQPVSNICDRTPCRKSVLISNINPGQQVTFAGLADYEIFYQAYSEAECFPTQTSCISGVNGYRPCVDGQIEDIVYCEDLGQEFFCDDSGGSGAYCAQAYTSQLFAFRDFDDSKDVSGYVTGQQPKLRYRFTSSITTQQTNAKFKLYDDSENLIETINTLVSPGTTGVLTFSTIDVPGEYYVVAELDYQGNIILFGQSKEIDFSVSSIAISSQFETSTSLIDPESGNQYTSYGDFYSSNDIKIEFSVFETGSPLSKIQFQSYDISATYNDLPITLPQPVESVGMLTYNLNFESSGILHIEGTATRLGVQTDLATKNLEIKEPVVSVQYKNVNNIEAILPGDSYDIKFETRSSIGNIISTSNSVKMLLPDGTDEDISNSVIGSGGAYEFPYTFNLPEGYGKGGFQIFITSSAIGHKTSVNTPSSIISVDPNNEGEIVVCDNDDDCYSDEKCSNGKCVPDRILPTYVIIIIIVVIILIVLIFISFYKKRREPSFGL